MLQVHDVVCLLYTQLVEHNRGDVYEIVLCMMIRDSSH